jgi:sporulation protein YlmC with PRC-barrel domain
MDNVKETSSLIAGAKVSGTNVYNRDGENIGAIQDVMIDKKMGKIAYALMSFGGFMGLGKDYHPLPWSLLKYDTMLGGYVVDLSKAQLEGAPGYPADSTPDFSDRDSETELHRYYGVGPYWMP